ncbi:hypothetical protein WIW50_02715 [Flavobacteriaceae bacterium 3-367]
MAKTYLPDTGFWIALYANNEEAETIATIIEDDNILIPYPSMYEFLNSKFSRRGLAYEFQKLLKRPNIKKIYDDDYRDDSFDNFFYNAINYSLDVSLVDEVIKLMIIDPKLKVDFLISYDTSLLNYATAHGVETN